MDAIPRDSSATLDKLGICQWFHYEAYQDLERAVEEAKALGIRHFRTGISWADFHRPKGREWYDQQMEALADFEILLSVWHVPPSISEGGTCAAPPKRLDDYADFIGQLIELYGERFSALELWNEPNNRLKWDFPNYDPQWEKFAVMISAAAAEAHARDVPTVLGGMIPVDHHWLRLMQAHGSLDDVDIVAIHAFPGMWWDDEPNWDWYRDWDGWADKVDYIAEHAAERPIWVTETGLATVELSTGTNDRFDQQVERLRRAASAPVPRVYWYSLIDLDPGREAIEGFHVDENEYHLGLVTYDGTRKPAWHEMRSLLEGEAVTTRGYEPPSSDR